MLKTSSKALPLLCFCLSKERGPLSLLLLLLNVNQLYVCSPSCVHVNTMFFPELLAMPLGKPAPQNKRKKLAKIITDLSHITQDGKAGME